MSAEKQARIASVSKKLFDIVRPLLAVHPGGPARLDAVDLHQALVRALGEALTESEKAHVGDLDSLVAETMRDYFARQPSA